VPEHLRGLSRDAYASLRRDEAEEALALSGTSRWDIRSLGAVDQEASFHMAELARALATILRERPPEMLVAHAYEGGHPDHDAAAFVSHAALALVNHGSPVPLVEMTSYHEGANGVVRGEFLRRAMPERVLSLDAVARARKAAMFACYASQRDVLEAFGVEEERFRVAAPYDFTAAPHGGELHYEKLGWPMTGEAWRTLARAAEKELGLERLRCASPS
jgi:LmbE family N-acetylglucosaminyl deacetylase